jgi:4-hydroxy-2-oxoglutarate aldolase
MIHKLSGIFAPVNTPFTSDEEVDYEGLTHNLKYYISTELSGILLLGSNSEYKSLDEEEKVKILETAIKIVAGNKTLIVGVMYDSFYHARRFIETSSRFPIDYLMVQPPFYFRHKLTDDDYFRFYADLSDISPFPVLIYNAPGFTGVDLSEQLINRIARLKRIQGIKDSSKTEKKLSKELAVLTGTVTTLYDMLEKQATGGVVSLANFIPWLPVKIFNEYRNGNKEQAKVLQEVAVELNRSVSGKHGVAGVKAAMDAAGLIGGALRRPLQKLPPGEQNKISMLIKEYRHEKQ